MGALTHRHKYQPSSDAHEKQQAAHARWRRRHFRSRLTYLCDKYIEQPSFVLLGFVAIGTACCFLFGGVWFRAQRDFDHGDDEMTYPEAVWQMWTFAADPGTHADAGGCADDGGATTWGCWARRMVALGASLVGIVLFSFITAFIVDAVMRRLRELEQGHSPVVERGHILVLGWSDKTLPLVAELAAALESEGGGVVVVLADSLPKEEMSARLRGTLRATDLAGTSVVLRHGNPVLTADLQRVGAAHARVILVLAAQTPDPTPAAARDADTATLRTVLALVSLHGLPRSTPIVAELHDAENEPLVSVIGGERVETVVQTTRQSPLTT